MKSGLYKIVCTESKTVYIGGTINWPSRKARHLHQLRHNKHHNIWLQRSWNKHGESAFQFIWVRDVVEADVLEEEQRLFDDYPERCNIAPFAAAPMLGRKHSPETIAKFKLRKPSRSMLGKKASDETKEKMSKARAGIPIPALQGRRLSEAHKAKISRKGTTYRSTRKGYSFHKRKNLWMVTVHHKFGGYFHCEADAADKANLMRDIYWSVRDKNDD